MMRHPLRAAATLVLIATLGCGDATEEAPAATPSVQAAPEAAPRASAGTFLDLNQASAEELAATAGLDPALADAVGKYVDEAEVARLERYVTIR